MTVTDLRRACHRFEHKHARKPKLFVVHPIDLAGVMNSCSASGGLGWNPFTIMGMKYSTNSEITRGTVMFASEETDSL